MNESSLFASVALTGAGGGTPASKTLAGRGGGTAYAPAGVFQWLEKWGGRGTKRRKDESTKRCNDGRTERQDGGDFPGLTGYIILDMVRGMKKQLHFTPQASDFLTEQTAIQIRKGVE